MQTKRRINTAYVRFEGKLIPFNSFWRKVAPLISENATTFTVCDGENSFELRFWSDTLDVARYSKAHFVSVRRIRGSVCASDEMFVPLKTRPVGV